jgi:uncharacterized damage-inducible protein DinB
MIHHRNSNSGKLAGELFALRELFSYNTYVRKKYLAFIAKLPKNTLAKDRGASYPTIIDIQTHILDVCRSWLHAYETAEDLPAPSGLTVPELVKFGREVNNYVDSFMKRLVPEDLNKSAKFTPGNGERVVTIRMREMLYHMIEEELQHRGELNALLWQDDIEPPVTDWRDWKEASSKRK